MSLETSNVALNDALQSQWSGAINGDALARAQWRPLDGGEWRWNSEGIRVKGTGPEWLTLCWQGWNEPEAGKLKNFVIEVVISGKAEAAGLSFGSFKDFLTNVSPELGAHHLQFEVDVDTNCWAFRVDGALMGRCWWDGAVESVADILGGALTLKVRHADEVLFQRLAIHPLEGSCRLSVITTCYRFLQRLRVSLRNWCHQDLPSGAYEVLVVNPQSPDGTYEHLAAVARSFPHVRVRQIAVDAEMVINKGAMINRAVAASRGKWVWLTDADCLYAPNCAATVLAQIEGQPGHLFYGQRRFLSPAETDALLAGRVDGLREFAELAGDPNDHAAENAPWGYTQIVHRSTLERVPYREDFNHFAHSDGAFAEDCKRLQITPLQVPGLFCLHMHHPFSWYGTNTFL